jgi:alpha-1,3/alpha-1,6-mannosyltransferase
MSPAGKKLRVAFIHPDLGIGACSSFPLRVSSLTWAQNAPGGAERLVVDAALGLQALGHTVDIYTSHHDPNHSFDETNNGA